MESIGGQPSLFEWAGGAPAFTRMTRLFYGKYVPRDPLLAPLFADMAPDHPERVAAWLGRNLRRPEDLQRAVRRLRLDGLAAPRQGDDRGATSPLGGADVPVRRRGRSPRGPGVPGRVRLLHRVGLADRARELDPGRRPPLHMPVPRWSWVNDATPGSRVSALAPQAEEDFRVHTHLRRAAQLRRPHQTAVPRTGSSVDDASPSISGRTKTSASMPTPSSSGCKTAPCPATPPGRRSASRSSSAGSRPAVPPERGRRRPRRLHGAAGTPADLDRVAVVLPGCPLPPLRAAPLVRARSRGGARGGACSRF